MQASHSKKKVLIVDDHALLREGLKFLISQSKEDFEVVGETPSASEALKLVKKLKPDIVILDLSLSDGSGLDIIEPIKKISQNTKILVLSMYQDESVIVQTLKEGASGFIPKSEVSEECIQALKIISESDDLYVPASYSRIVLKGLLSDNASKTLSSREDQVLRLLALGYSAKEIAQTLQISPKTVQTYRQRITTKLDLRRRSDIVRYAISKGLLKEEEIKGIVFPKDDELI
ncbi:two component transcriptional regulator, LuxR family [Thermodesulfobium narugense DSM 14796]|uniref:Two component transcriptional regulator, LuxR family n=1 Tax=Thermodesulfobium narugense DSM 14796 TaxID=747365 RepID=M1E8Q0_9BACT|nr:response regulator transcription factor [Thermodesulfobium narugense]AEE15283.1 two component transcriptional regulator, LuxR family [Thermodesulfobium narugense DSM 14796]